MAHTVSWTEERSYTIFAIVASCAVHADRCAVLLCINALLYISGGLYHLRRLCQSLHINALLCNRCRPLPLFVGRCGLRATTLFSDGGRHRSRVPIGGIYNAVFIRHQQNLHRLLRPPSRAEK
nr:MAG TPA: hypothetical protein [Bacteriophage sp.]